MPIESSAISSSWESFERAERVHLSRPSRARDRLSSFHVRAIRADHEDEGALA